MTTRNPIDMARAIGTLTDALGELMIESAEYRLNSENSHTLDAAIARANVAFYASPAQQRPARVTLFACVDALNERELLTAIRADSAERIAFNEWRNRFRNETGRAAEPVDAWQARAVLTMKLAAQPLYFSATGNTSND